MHRFALFLVGLAALAVNTEAADEKKPKPELSPAVRPIVEMARAAAPEFFADTIATLVEAGKIPQRELQVELLEEAFNVAAGAQQPWRLNGISAIPPDSRAMYRGKAGALRLDALSLQSRILKAMLTVDRPKTRELFERLRHPVLQPRPCEDPMVDDISAYYEIAGPLAQSAFTAAEKEKGVHVQFLATMIAGTQVPGELAPFAMAIQSVALRPPELELLLGALAQKLETITADYRSFATSINGLQSDIQQLLEIARANGVGVDPLMQGFGKYLTTQLKAPRCNEDIRFGPIDWFHGAPTALTDEETKAIVRNGALKTEAYFESEDSKRLGQELNALRFTPERKPLSEAERSSLEWRNSLNDFMSDFAGWRPSGSDIDVFHQKATVWGAVLQLVPPGADRDRIVNASVTFLRSSDIERQSPAEWLWQVKKLEELATVDAPKMLQAFRASGDVGLVLYATLGRGAGL
jgi:hypothetical protein